MADTGTLTRRAVTEAVDPRHWRVAFTRLRAVYRTPDFATGAAFVARVAAAADEANHHPDVVLRYGDVTVTLESHDVGGLTDRDVRMAGTVAGIADELGLAPEPERVRAYEIALDAIDIPKVMPFWEAVLAYRSVGDDELVDPSGLGPTFWFQQMDAPRTERNRFHIDVSVPHDQALARVRAALEAGGRLLAEQYAPRFWVLADPEGNEACVCTWRGRDPDDRDAGPDPAVF